MTDAKASHHTVQLGTSTLAYRLQRKCGLKALYLSVDDEGVLVKAATWVPRRDIETFLRQKEGWVSRRLAQLHRRNTERASGRIRYLGALYAVRQQRSKGCTRAVLLEEKGGFVARLPERAGDDTVFEALVDFYRLKAPESLLPVVRHWAKRMGAEPAAVSFRRARTRWGSCSAKNRISLNIYLMMLPPELAEYVIVHELAHLVHKNHSQAFWKLVGNHLPDWKKRRKALRAYEGYLR